MKALPFLPFLLAALLLASCSTAYYAGMEKIGFHKRDILVKRVAKAKGSQEEAKEQFQSALDEFIAVTEYKGDALEKKYRVIDSAYTKAKARAEEVKSRNDDVARVGKALFKEWDREIKEFQSADLRYESKRQRDLSERRFDNLMAVMRRAEARLDPVLKEFRDQVLFLKHNLNSRAIAALEGKAAQVKIDVGRLVREMEASIAEADSFIREMRTGS